MMIVFAAAVVASGGAIWVALRLRRISAPASAWPAGLTPAGVRRRARSVLIDAGWDMINPWGWHNILVRATKNGRVLNLLVPEDWNFPLPSIVRDATKIAQAERVVIAILTYGFSAADVEDITCSPRVLLVGGDKLPHADRLLAARAEMLAREREPA